MSSQSPCVTGDSGERWGVFQIAFTMRPLNIKLHLHVKITFVHIIISRLLLKKKAKPTGKQLDLLFYFLSMSATTKLPICLHLYCVLILLKTQFSRPHWQIFRFLLSGNRSSVKLQRLWLPLINTTCSPRQNSRVRAPFLLFTNLSDKINRIYWSHLGVGVW